MRVYAWKFRDVFSKPWFNFGLILFYLRFLIFLILTVFTQWAAVKAARVLCVIENHWWRWWWFTGIRWTPFCSASASSGEGTEARGDVGQTDVQPFVCDRPCNKLYAGRQRASPSSRARALITTTTLAVQMTLPNLFLLVAWCMLLHVGSQWRQSVCNSHRRHVEGILILCPCVDQLF